ncbi:MAG: aminotransferase class V-fold PLP-dependent enzyme [Acidimicrobiia bacterium]|nr:MAG: aminotransferase class V-fold PLP-dependent enzyme [Acidimicrobiia bacterium]
MLDDQRHLFDVPADVAYLNSAYFGPRLTTVTAAGREAIDRTAAPWNVSPPDFFDPAEHLRATVGRLLGDDGEGVAIIPSISYGIGVAAGNLTVGQGRTVVLLDEQFPSNVYPWRAKVAREGGEIVTVPRSLEGWTAAILDRIDDRTAVVAVPNCHWTDGSRVDLEAVGEAARSSGAAFVVDASQSFGAMPLDVGKVLPDFLATVGYKWQLGFYGVGYLWVAEQHRIGVPLEEGWITRKDASNFAGLVDYADAYEPGARRFDVGERSNFIGIAMANAAMDQIASWGVPEIASTLGVLTSTIADGAVERGWNSVADDQRSPHMIGIRRPGGLPDSFGEALAKANVSVSVRGDSVRVAPHLHTVTDDVERLLDVLDAMP